MREKAAEDRLIAKATLFQLAKALDGLPVLGCLHGTPAALAGVRYGDILLSVNGQRTRTFGDYVEAKALRSDGMSIVVFRAGQESPLEFNYNPSPTPVDPTALLAELIGMRAFPTEIEGSGSGNGMPS